MYPRKRSWLMTSCLFALASILGLALYAELAWAGCENEQEQSGMQCTESHTGCSGVSQNLACSSAGEFVCPWDTATDSKWKEKKVEVDSYKRCSVGGGADSKCDHKKEVRCLVDKYYFSDDRSYTCDSPACNYTKTVCGCEGSTACGGFSR